MIKDERSNILYSVDVILNEKDTFVAAKTMKMLKFIELNSAGAMLVCVVNPGGRPEPL